VDLVFNELFAVPIWRLWAALTDSDELGLWLMPPTNFKPQQGQKFILRAAPKPGWRGWVECEVLAIDQPHLMIWAWSSDVGEDSRLTFELSEEGQATRLILRHAGNINQTAADLLRGGWLDKLAALATVLGPPVSPEEVQRP
jgi:uncharacterized protein YndB with AHSA1/START domain